MAPNAKIALTEMWHRTAISVAPEKSNTQEVDQYSTHIYRRTTATLVERAAGLTLASRLLGHANEQITRTSYVVSAAEDDPITLDVLDVLGGAAGELKGQL